MPDLLLAEELLLLALDEEKGKDQTFNSLDPALAGALLLDLAGDGHLREEGDALAPAEESLPREPLLAEALEVIRASDKARKPSYWLSKLPGKLKPLPDRVADRLVERGVLSKERHKVLGLFPDHRYPEVDPAPERALRERLQAVLVGGEQPPARTVALLSLMRPYDLVQQVVPKEQRREAKKRAKALTEEEAIGSAVSDHVTAAVMTAVIGGAAGGAAGTAAS